MCGNIHMSGVCGTLKDSLEKEQANSKKGLLQSKLISITGCCELDKYDFLYAEGQAPDTVHPNLWEQAKLNLQYGLYRVNNIVENEERGADGQYALHAGDVFQIRGYDISNMTLVYDGSGWIVMDVLTTITIAGVVWQEVVQTYLSASAPIHMVIYSHSHVDHYGGIGGLKPYFAKEGVQILAPEGFMEHAVSENVYAGTAMSRRAVYQMGGTLQPGRAGHVDCGLGKMTTQGGNSIIEPTKEIGFDDYGGKKYYEATCGQVPLQRDMYRYVNNATLHLVNLAYTIDEVGRMVSDEDGTMPLPEEFANEWCSHGYYGTYNHDAKAVYQRYIGWYDGNPAHLNRHKPVERATRQDTHRDFERAWW